MSPEAPDDESNQSLWFVIAAPLCWAAHFLVSYATVAVWCERYAGRDGSLYPARVAVAAFTAAALAGIGLIALAAWRRYQHGGGTEAFDADTPLGRHRFIGSATLLLSALSAVATAYSALTVVFIRDCH